MFTALFMLNCYRCGDFYPILHTSKDKDRMAWLAEISDLLYEVEHNNWTHIRSESGKTDQYICSLCADEALHEAELQSLLADPY
jgi:hypothetical protein